MVTATSFRSVSCAILEPLKYIHAMPAFISLSFSHFLQTPTKLFSVAFYSTLKTPISLPPSFETTPIARFLLNECGFSLHDASAICARKPDLLCHKSYDNSRQTLLFLRDKGFHEIGIRKIFSKEPRILRSSFQDNVKPKVEFLEKIGLTGQKLAKAIEGLPGILSRNSIHALESKIYFLQSALDPELASVVSNPESDKTSGKLVSNHSLTASVISENPRILHCTEKLLVGLAKDVEEMGIEKGSKAFARVLLRLSMLNRDTIKRKLENLRELGFTEEEAGIILKKFPTFLGLSEDRLRRNFKFLVEEWKLPQNAILIYPMALGYSTEKRLRPRLQSLKALLTKNKSSKEAESYPLVRYLFMAERDFRCKVVSRLQVSNEEQNPREALGGIKPAGVQLVALAGWNSIEELEAFNLLELMIVFAVLITMVIQSFYFVRYFFSVDAVY